MSDLLDTADIARLLEITREHCTDRVTKRPDFPAPAVNLSRRLRRWRKQDIRQAFEIKDLQAPCGIGAGCYLAGGA